MGIKDIFNRFSAARRKNQPERDTVPYPRIVNIGLMNDRKAQIKPTPPNIRYFSRTPYARAAIRRIRDPLCSLNWEIVPQKGVSLNRTLKKQIATATTCFHHPNLDDSWRSFLGLVVEDYLVFGAGPFEHQLGTDPVRPLWMWPVDAQSIQIFSGWSGASNEARYIQTLGFSNVGFIEGRRLRNDELVYIRANSSNETPYGFGSLEIAFNTIERSLGVSEFTGNLATNAQPQFMLFFPNASPDQLAALRTYWRNEVEGQGVTPIVGFPGKPEAIKLYPGGDDALYLKYQEWLVREVATSFGLSPMNLGLEGDVNRSTAEISKERDWDNTVIPLAELISNHLTREVLHAKLGFYSLEFKFEGLYREDDEGLANVYQIEYKNNAITPNEYRISRGLPPMESKWGDLTFADVQIATNAARGTALIADPDLSDTGATPASLKQQDSKDTQNIADSEND